MGSKQSKKYAEDSGEEEQDLQPVQKEEYQGSGAEMLVSEDDSKAGGFGGNFDVSSSEEEITRKVVKKAAPRKLGPPQDKEDSSKSKMSSSKLASKKPTAVKKKFIESSDEENRPLKKSKARQVVDSGDDSDFEVESIAAKPRTTGNYWGVVLWKTFFMLGNFPLDNILIILGKCLSYCIFIANCRWEKEGGGQLWARRFIRQRLLRH